MIRRKLGHKPGEKLVMGGLLIALAFEAVWGIVSGNSPGSSVHFSPAYRVIMAFVLIGLTIYFVKSFRELARIEKDLAESTRGAEEAERNLKLARARAEEFDGHLLGQLSVSDAIRLTEWLAESRKHHGLVSVVLDAKGGIRFQCPPMTTLHIPYFTADDMETNDGLGG